MSNVRNLFSDRENQPQIEQPATEGTFNPEIVIASSLADARKYAAESDQPRTIVSVDSGSVCKLEMAAVDWQQTPYFVFVRSLSTLILDEAFELTEEDKDAATRQTGRSFQLKTDFYKAVSEFAIERKTTADVLADIAVSRYLPATPRPAPSSQFKPRRHLRSV